jgi:ATP-dependent helicase/nuclease subunit A
LPLVPTWLHEPAPAQAPRRRRLSPSAAFDDEIGRMAPQGAAAIDRQKALQRGRLAHRLLQALPDIPADRRSEAAERYLANAAKDFSPAERAEIAAQIFAILDSSHFVEVFAAGSRPEVPIVGRIAGKDAAPIEVAGQVDRLIVTGDAVLIADYKTDSVVPKGLGEVAPYVAQLALYRAVLAPLYPGKTIRAALIFTQGPRLMEIPARELDTALETALQAALTRA